MEETKARVDALILKLNDLSPEIRLEAIKELSTIDKQHALPALHWAIQNELDDAVRNAARDAYQTLSQLNEAPPDKSPSATADKTREIEHPKVKAVVLEEGLPNSLGRLSLYFATAVIILYIAVIIIESGQDQTNIPVFFKRCRVVIPALSIPGLVLGILALTKRGYKHFFAYIGMVTNAIIFLLFSLKVLLRAL